MKTKMLSLVALFLLGAFSIFAAEKSEKFEVKGGSCDECVKHIEQTALSVDGVTSAEWNKETSELTVVFDDSKTNVNSIELEEANAGHDTDKYKAPQDAYDKLQECCKYGRE